MFRRVVPWCDQGESGGKCSMCLAIPGEVVQLDNEMAVVRVGDALRKASLMLLPEPAQLGDYVIIHAGFALHKVDPVEAQESLQLLRQLASFGEQEDQKEEGS